MAPFIIISWSWDLKTHIYYDHIKVTCMTRSKALPLAALWLSIACYFPPWNKATKKDVCRCKATMYNGKMPVCVKSSRGQAEMVGGFNWTACLYT